MSESSSIETPDAQKTILLAGFTTGTLDILSALFYTYIKTGKNPIVVLKYVASGAFGTAALSGGTAVVIWGLVFHFMIAFIFTTFFFLIYPRLKFLSVNKWLTAIGYGLFVWCVMNLLVVPFSQVPKSTFHLTNALINAAILICMIGLPNTWIIGKYYAKSED